MFAFVRQHPTAVFGVWGQRQTAGHSVVQRDKWKDLKRPIMNESLWELQENCSNGKINQSSTVSNGIS